MRVESAPCLADGDRQQAPWDVVDKFVFDVHACREYAVLWNGREVDFDSSGDKFAWGMALKRAGPARERALRRFGL